MAGLSQNLQKRIIAALALLPPVIAFVWLGGVAMLCLMLLAGFIMAYEWYGIIGRNRRLLWAFVAFCVSGFAAWTGLAMGAVASGQGTTFVAFQLSSLAFLLFALIQLAKNTGKENTGEENRGKTLPYWHLAGLCYISIAFFALGWLRSLDENGLYVFWVLLAVAATDVGGYFAGKGLGGPKLAPHISPSKTWSGLLGGMFLAACVSYLFAYVFAFGPRSVMFMAGAVIAFVAQAGDLFESFVKRRFGVKDSGRILPGHGGLLDRVDGLVFAAPAAAFAILVWDFFEALDGFGSVLGS